MFCKNCGTQLPDGAQFCANCGSSTDPNAPVKPVKPARTAVLNEKYQMPTWKILYLVAVGLLLLGLIFHFTDTMGMTASGYGQSETERGPLTDVIEGEYAMELDGWGNMTILMYIAAIIIPGLPFIPMLKFKFSPSKLLALRITSIWSMAWILIGDIYLWAESAESFMGYSVYPVISIWGVIQILLLTGALILSFIVGGKMKKANGTPAPAAPVYYPVQ
ncbi:MAG: zinc ribbon domain-containing protein [Clostridia bacterium]|nr:zinc ribbon domain-containing protein [Clostridia bacterium]